jgi:hypothetical protein
MNVTPAVLAAALLVLLPPAFALETSPAEIAVHVVKDGPHVAVDIDFVVDAPWPVIWDVLTDYDHMAEFISNVASSSIVARTPEGALRVHQKGSATIGPFSFPFNNVREVELAPHSEIRSRLVSGDFKASSFVTRIVLVDGRIHVVNQGRYTPNMWVPPLLGPALIAAETRKQFGEIRAEILRRSAQLRQPGIPQTPGLCASGRSRELVPCNLGPSERLAPSQPNNTEKETK